ncbi:MAG: phosphoglucomutase/phosphomannomutase family protein [Clostridia bacterium]|nr:phosphoglucomutase/phosphomannomutase family protein [Clostridia bacterium]
MRKIRFGTDGWRAVMAEEFTFAHVRAVAQGIASHVKKEGRGEQGLVVGYDNRFLGKEFAAAVGEVLAGNGIPVFLTKKATPTPVTAFAITQHETAGAVMLTASHNPPEYNGIKFIPHDAGPALPEVTDAIEAFVQEALTGGEIKRAAREEVEKTPLWQIIDPKLAYLDHLRQLLDWEKMQEAAMKVIVNPMHGAGIGYLEELLTSAGWQVITMNAYRDPLFGGKLPEPTGEVLEDMGSELLARGARLGLALDGDADRFGIIDEDGRYINPNQVLALLYVHLLERRGLVGPVARTVATTHLLDRIAEAHGLGVFETPVGFKYIGRCLLEKGCVLGGEESGGLSIKGHLPEKDGILAAALVAEIVAVTGCSVGANLEDIYGRYGRLVSRRLDVRVPAGEREQLLARVKEYQPAKMGGVPVLGRILVDGTKLLLADGGMVLIRPSGTEPLFRIYVETSSEEKLAQMQKEVREELGM